MIKSSSGSVVGQRRRSSTNRKLSRRRHDRHAVCQSVTVYQLSNESRSKSIVVRSTCSVIATHDETKSRMFLLRARRQRSASVFTARRTACRRLRFLFLTVDTWRVKRCILLGRIARTTYVDADYCYRLSSVVCQSVCHDREPCKNAKPIGIPYGI